MNYEELNYLLAQHTEINYVDDCEVFFDDNNLNMEDYKNTDCPRARPGFP